MFFIFRNKLNLSEVLLIRKHRSLFFSFKKNLDFSYAYACQLRHMVSDPEHKEVLDLLLDSLERNDQLIRDFRN